MDVFKKDITYLSLLLNFIRSNRHILMKYEPESMKERLEDYGKEQGYDNLEELAKSILMAPYLSRFNILAKVHFATLKKHGMLDNTLINVLKNRLIYDLTQDESEVGKGKEEQSWLVRLMTKKVDLGFSQGGDKNQLNILYLNTSRGFGAYNLNFEMKYLLPTEWTYHITGIDPLKENVDFAQEGDYLPGFFPPDYSHKDKFSKKGDLYSVKEEHRSKLEFQHLDILDVEPHVLTEKFKEKFDLVVASNARSFYTLPIFFKIVEKVLPMLKVGSYLYTGVENIKDLKNFEHLDILSIDNIAFYRRNRNVIVKNIFSAMKEEEENCNNLLTSAHTQFLGENYDQVLQYTYHILNKEVDNRKAILVRCLALIGKGNYRLAKNMIRQAHILNAMDFDADLCSAFVNFKTGDEEEAREDLHNALSHFNFNKIYRVIQCSPEEEKIFLARWERISNLLGGDIVLPESTEPVEVRPPKKEKKKKTVTIEDERYGKVQIEVEEGKESEHLMLSGSGEGAVKAAAQGSSEPPAPAVTAVKQQEKPPALKAETPAPKKSPTKVMEAPPRAELIRSRHAELVHRLPLSKVEDPYAPEPEVQQVDEAEAVTEAPGKPVFAVPGLDTMAEVTQGEEIFSEEVPAEEVVAKEESPEPDVVEQAEEKTEEETVGEALAEEAVTEEVVTEEEPLKLKSEPDEEETVEEVSEPEQEKVEVEEEPAAEAPREEKIITRKMDPYKTAIMTPEFREAIQKEVREAERPSKRRRGSYKSFARGLEPSSRQSKGSDAFRREGEEDEEPKKRSRHSDAFKTREIDTGRKKRFDSDPYGKAKTPSGDEYFSSRSFDVVDMYMDPYKRPEEKEKKKSKKKRKSSSVYKTAIMANMEEVKKIREAEEKRVKAEAEKAAAEQAARAEAEKAAAEQAARAEAEKAAAEQAARAEAEKAAAEQAARDEAEKAAAEQAARAEAEKAAAEQAARAEAEKAAAEQAAKDEAEKAAAEQAARDEAEKAEPKPEKKSKKRRKKPRKGYDTVEIPDFSFHNPFAPPED